MPTISQLIRKGRSKVVYKGTIAGETQMKGEVDYAGLGKGNWTATRK